MTIETPNKNNKKIGTSFFGYFGGIDINQINPNHFSYQAKVFLGAQEIPKRTLLAYLKIEPLGQIIKLIVTAL